MNMNIWFIIYLFLIGMNLGSSLVSHGKPKEGKENFWANLIGSAISIFIVVMAMRG